MREVLGEHEYVLHVQKDKHDQLTMRKCLYVYEVFSNQSSPFLAVPLTIGNFVALEIRINGSTRYCWVHICQAVRYIRYQVKADKVCSWNICEQKYFKAVSFRLHMNYEKPFYTLTHLTSL